MPSYSPKAIVLQVPLPARTTRHMETPGAGEEARCTHDPNRTIPVAFAIHAAEFCREVQRHHGRRNPIDWMRPRGDPKIDAIALV